MKKFLLIFVVIIVLITNIACFAGGPWPEPTRMKVCVQEKNLAKKIPIK